MLQNIKEGIAGHAANWYSDVFDIVFPNLDEAEVSSLWQAQLTKPDKNGKSPKESEDDD